MLGNSVNFELLTPVTFLKRTAAIYGHKDAVVHGEKRFTYKEFEKRVNRLANALMKLGISKGDKVAFLCPNTPPMLEAHFAVPIIGATLVSVNIRLSPREISHIINHSDTKALFADNEFSSSVTPILSELRNVQTFVNICDVSEDRPLYGPDYEQFLAAASDTPVNCAVEDEREVATLNYTSGTTGLPKGVMYHHRGAYLNALGEALESGLNHASVYLWTLPMFHCNGWCFPWAVTAVGATHVCLRKVVAEEIFRLIEVENVSHLCAAPTVLVSMSNYVGTKRVKVKQKLQIMTAGAPPAPTVIAKMEETGAIVTHTYGLTEVYGPHSICAPQAEWENMNPTERARIKSRQGVPYVTALYMDVVNPTTMEPIPRDGETQGEIVMRGNNVMLGYYKDDKASEIAFRGGWFHSGDLAVIHPDGYVEIKDRSKDVIISGGENISSVEVENAIYRHPEVLEVAVVGVPDPKWGEVPKAFVTLKPGAKTSAEDLINFCRENIARFKVPKHIEFRELPKTATGKILKYELRNKEWAGREKKVN